MSQPARPPSSSIHWNTPEHVLQAVRSVFGGPIGLDPCFNASSITQPGTCYDGGINSNGLLLPWASDSVFVNPPFGVSYLGLDGSCLVPKEYKERCKLDPTIQANYTKQTLGQWVAKCAQEAHTQPNTNVIALIPACVDTKAWHNHILNNPHATTCLNRGRMKFLVDGKPSANSAPMPVALVLFSKSRTLHYRFALEMAGLGAMIRCP